MTNETLPVIQIAPESRGKATRSRVEYPPHPPGSPVVAAVIAGLAIYLPVGLRGALIGLMPAIAWRSWRLAAWGLGCGAFAELLTIRAIDWGWNSYDPYCGLLLDYLPPMRVFAFPSFSSISNPANFVLGLVAWTGMIFTIWFALWPGRKSWTRYGIFILVAGVGTAGSAIRLWSAAPDGFSGYGASSPAEDLVARRFLLFPFFFALPPAFTLAGWTLARVTRRFEADMPADESP